MAEPEELLDLGEGTADGEAHAGATLTLEDLSLFERVLRAPTSIVLSLGSILFFRASVKNKVLVIQESLLSNSFCSINIIDGLSLQSRKDHWFADGPAKVAACCPAGTVGEFPCMPGSPKTAISTRGKLQMMLGCTFEIEPQWHPPR